VSFAVLVRSAKILGELPREHFIHVYGWTGKAAGIEDVKDYIDEFFGDFLFVCTFLQSDPGFA
jgi:hypothetical protein